MFSCVSVALFPDGPAVHLVIVEALSVLAVSVVSRAFLGVFPGLLSRGFVWRYETRSEEICAG